MARKLKNESLSVGIGRGVGIALKDDFGGNRNRDRLLNPRHPFQIIVSWSDAGPLNMLSRPMKLGHCGDEIEGVSGDRSRAYPTSFRTSPIGRCGNWVNLDFKILSYCSMDERLQNTQIIKSTQSTKYSVSVYADSPSTIRHHAPPQSRRHNSFLPPR